ncbi:response regulator [Caballeronia glebae]|uniref:response regulator n=1 Tax=Caballeronia glebae TaxID=1777143 RepID=UPI0038BA6348
MARFSLNFSRKSFKVMQRSPSFHLWTNRRFDTVEPPVQVLIVDDDRNVADALGHALESGGMTVTIAYDGAEAIRSVQRLTPHVVILDIQMPDTDGFKVARALRTWRRFDPIPIIAHTSLPEREIVDRARAVLMDAYCRKGKSVKSLLKLIEVVAPTHGLSGKTV